MVGTSVPLHELVGETPPPVVLDLLVGLVTAALARGLDHFHPAQVRLGTGARVTLTAGVGLAPHPVTAAPELASTGPDEATLVYAAAASAVLAAIPRLPAPPPDRDGHVAWVHDVEARLRAHWAHELGGSRAAMILIGCLAWDRARRPGVRRLLDEVRSLALPSEDGLVRFTGACAPCIPGELPDRTPAPAPSLSFDVTPSYSRPSRGPVASPNRTPSLSSPLVAPLAGGLPAPRRVRPGARSWARVGITVGMGCALLAGAGLGVVVPALLLAPDAAEPTPAPEPDRVRSPVGPALPRTPAPVVRAPAAEAPAPASVPLAPERAAAGETPEEPQPDLPEAPAEAASTDEPAGRPPKRFRIRLPGPRD